MIQLLMNAINKLIIKIDNFQKKRKENLNDKLL